MFLRNRRGTRRTSTEVDRVSRSLQLDGDGAFDQDAAGESDRDCRTDGEFFGGGSRDNAARVSMAKERDGDRWGHVVQ
jgi:hypothetical protein